MQQNELFIVLSGCGDAARYLTMNAARRKIGPEGLLLRTKSSSADDSSAAPSDVAGAAEELSARRLEGGTAGADASGTHLEQVKRRRGTYRLCWTPEMAMKFEAARKQFYGPGAGAWGIFAIREAVAETA
eukprot:GHVT01099072.1.p1 GENE.GHVT01099072.1~~GHVT01099072.1.p1  ORF type:complete len:130 (+),score=34.45 GHVT01099072.1:806-1195(+)